MTGFGSAKVFLELIDFNLTRWCESGTLAETLDPDYGYYRCSLPTRLQYTITTRPQGKMHVT